ncbi:hypothetical protein CH330_09780 [candidate division WOR-3 bacterium JGI_Cruoil_03_51_56]|uniref:CBM-cenC domain-containing protein n=1 Tax=candidate division WOR-3 bacterium JGI_Cruoil_03_51_56 TaxID=1973747 RepID=A0A235BQC2_UNCW3|nr:MAG: hypothetical protein CH330_09780 [candidate division WOR-3 bacterium JGI_Cruoil_03_51_56]
MRILRFVFLLFLAVTPVRALNILPNSSFEYWIDTLGVHMPLGWITSEPLYPGSAVKSTESHTGLYCVKLTGGDTAAFVSTITIVRPDYHYHFSGWAKVPSLIGGSFILQFTKLLGEPIGTPEMLPAFHSSDYREYDRWVTAPESAVFLSVSFAAIPTATVYLDDVTLEDTAIIGIEEYQTTKTSEPHPDPRKVIAPVGITRTLEPLNSGSILYDPLGRRVCPDRLRPGVYFILRKR